jgi:hypothetical protein
MTNRSFHLPKSPAEIEAVAKKFVPGHDLLLAGYVLCGGSRCWASKRGITARLVYRQRDLGRAGIHTLTLIVKGIPWGEP